MKRALNTPLLGAILVVIGACGGAASPQADTLVARGETVSNDQRVQLNGQQAEFEQAVNEMKAACGLTTFEGSIDWASFSGSRWQTHSVSSYCSPPITALSTMCGRGESGTAYVREHARSMTCRHAGNAERALTVTDGNITFTVDFEAANADEYAQAELDAHL